MPPAGPLIPREFFLRDAPAVARDLPGRVLRHGEVALRITEVEAYGGPEDSASHCRSGRTERNAPMWEEGGCAYVYLCYGMHHLLNVVTGPRGRGEAVLIRSCEVLEGLETVLRRRAAPAGPRLAAGPGKVAQALGLDRSFNGHLLYLPGGLELHTGERPPGLLAGPRVGVPYARDEDRKALLRFAAAGTDCVTEARSLKSNFLF